VVAASVKLVGISAAQFDSTAETAFKTVVASYLSICGTDGATQCAAADVTIVSASRRDLSVRFEVKTISSAKASAGATTLTTAIDTNAAQFKIDLVAKGGALGSVSGTTIIAAAAAGTAPAGTAPAGPSVAAVGHTAVATISTALLALATALY
jgi:hypothetical protein